MVNKMNYRERNHIRTMRIKILRALERDGMITVDGIRYVATDHVNVTSHGEGKDGKLLLVCNDCGASDFNGSFDNICCYIKTYKDGVLGYYDPYGIIERTEEDQ